MNQLTTYVGQRSFSSKVILQTDRQTTHRITQTVTNFVRHSPVLHFQLTRCQHWSNS